MYESHYLIYTTFWSLTYLAHWCSHKLHVSTTLLLVYVFIFRFFSTQDGEESTTAAYALAMICNNVPPRLPPTTPQLLPTQDGEDSATAYALVMPGNNLP